MYSNIHCETVSLCVCNYQDASSDRSSIPCCNIGLKRRVSGKGTLAGKKQNKPQLIVNIIQYTRQNIYHGVMYLLVTNPEKVQLIHPPMRIMGSTFVTLPFIMSVSMLGSVGCYNHIVKHMSAKKKKR